MLQYGLNITAANDELQKIPVDRLYQAIARPKESFRTQVQRLRLVRSMDEKQYSRLKRELPYFVCGHFHPPYRRRENFSVIQHFVVDLDHFAEADKDQRAVREQLQGDPRLLLLFTSPGGDGLKLMFRLSEKCFDAGLYTLFYKAFTLALAQQYGLEQVIDWRTHDVTRACFLSFDPAAWFNPEAEAIVLEQFFDPRDPDAQRQVAEERKALREQSPTLPSPEREPLNNDALLEIKKKLNPNFRPRKKPEPVVPPQLDGILPRIEQRLREMNMELVLTESIQYGKQLRVAAGEHWAEVNVFFGQRGFSVVKTTRTGSNAELAQMAYQILYELLSE